MAGRGDAFSEDFIVPLSLAPLLILAAVAQSDDLSCAIHLSPCHVDTRLTMAGVEDKQVVQVFLESLRTATREGDREALAGMVQYPISVRHESGSREYRTPEELTARFDQVFTPAVLAAIGEAQYQTLFINAEGAMIGDGEIWFDGWTGPILIKAINP
mgnify:FL=1